jgi:uncharacterized protein YndB with AHSA1/START domain
MDRGSYLEYDGQPAVRFQRRFAHPVARVWQAITSPDELAMWFPSRVELEPRVGGTIRFSGDPHVAPSTGTVLTFEPPHRLGFSWGDDELQLSVEPAGDAACILTLINVLSARDAAARNAAGWCVCLAELDAVVSTGRADGPHADSGQSWRAYYEVAVADGLPSGAAIPSPS